MDIQGFPYKDIILGALLRSKDYKTLMLPVTRDKLKKKNSSIATQLNTEQTL